MNRSKCKVCKGVGTVREICPYCNGNSIKGKYCLICRSKGTVLVPCKSCEGRGKIELQTVWK